MHASRLPAILSAVVAQALLAQAAPAAADPCAEFAGQAFVPPAQALACLKSFPFNETLRQNVLNNVARVFDFYTFEDFYLNSPPPFQESTTNIRADLARINSTKFEVSSLVSFPMRKYVLTTSSPIRRIMTSTERFTTLPLS